MKYRNSDEIRQVWLDFFKSKGHFEEPSASLIPDNDPTLLWINAGVAALKKYFDGSTTPPHRRIVNAQKSLRTNDIENVGKTARHHTFFEMLGNFSIGDYFRNEVIPWAYELLTDEKYLGFDKNKLYITYYPDDLATKELWIKCGIDPSHLVPNKNNFWEIGEGPCGPDTEINYDRGEEYDPDHLGLKLLEEDLDNDRFIEVWNIVFSQFNAKPGLKREEYPTLPHKNIDTGCSLERLACIIQNTETNFETDFFMPTIKEIERNSKIKYEGNNKFYYRVIADHIRSLVFTLADGASFSNEGRGYVLRRLLRRAAKYCSNLGLKVGFLSSLVPVVIKTMHNYYPYLDSQKDRISKMILSEETKFSKTLNNGEKVLLQLIQSTKGNKLSGQDAFKLSDTYGFPIELTVEIAASYNKEVDMIEYQSCLKKQKELARNSRNVIDSFQSQNKDLMEFTLPSEFTYNDKVISSKIIAIFEDGKLVKKQTKDEVIIITEKTNFYAESGGQVPDTGLVTTSKFEAEVVNVQKSPNNQHMMFLKVNYGNVKVGDKVKLIPDFNRRNLTKKNHSSAHLLQAALHEIVDKNIKQQGSFVSPDMMRFDFSFDRKLTQDEINNVEALVNKKIFESLKTSTQILSKEEAMKLDAIHLFNEKYGEKVRVVSFGDFSCEFCAGTHVSNTKDIDLFTIVSEQAISSGVRRIIAYTSMKAYQFLKEKDLLLNNLAEKMQLNSYKEIDKRIDTVSNEIELLKKKNSQLESKITSMLINTSNSSDSETYDIKNNNIKFIVKQTSEFSHNQIVELVSQLKAKNSQTVILLLNKNNDKVDLAVGVSQDLLSKVSAGNLVKLASTSLNGSGGGRPDLAFGGAKSLENKQLAIDSLIKELESK